MKLAKVLEGEELLRKKIIGAGEKLRNKDKMNRDKDKQVLVEEVVGKVIDVDKEFGWGQLGSSH